MRGTDRARLPDEAAFISALHGQRLGEVCPNVRQLQERQIREMTPSKQPTRSKACFIVASGSGMKHYIQEEYEKVRILPGPYMLTSNRQKGPGKKERCWLLVVGNPVNERGGAEQILHSTPGSFLSPLFSLTGKSHPGKSPGHYNHQYTTLPMYRPRPRTFFAKSSKFMLQTKNGF